MPIQYLFGNLDKSPLPINFCISPQDHKVVERCGCVLADLPEVFEIHITYGSSNMQLQAFQLI
jgi:hypothetical protein